MSSITQKLETMAEDPSSLQPKAVTIIQKLQTVADHNHSPQCKAVTILLPYAVQLEKGGQPEMLDTLLHCVSASGSGQFTWWQPNNQLISTWLSEASPRATALVSVYIDWLSWMNGEGFVRWWVEGVSAIPYTGGVAQEVAQGVVTTLLRIASDDKLASHIPGDLWMWLTKLPSLPPVCKGRYCGTSDSVVKVIRELKDIEILKSYLLLIWSEWDALQSSGLAKICTSIREDFGGI